MKQRIESLDYLRGLLALSVLAYHYYVWSGGGGSQVVHEFLYRTGIYAVLMFYVISGISFGYVYRSMPMDRGALVEFWTKRFFRLAPLYWLAMAGVLLLTIAAGAKLPSPIWIIMNASLTFGPIQPHAYLVTGGWSIGNEMAYYIVFPFILVVLRRSRWAYAILLLASVGLGSVFAFHWLSSGRPLADQWTVYIYPASHLFYFGSSLNRVGDSWAVRV